MDKNYAANNHPGYYKDPSTYQTTPTSYPDAYHHQQSHHSTDQEKRLSVAHSNYYTDPNFNKFDLNSKLDNVHAYKNSYNNYNHANYKDATPSQYYQNYYDQYKFNVGLGPHHPPPATISNLSQYSRTKEDYFRVNHNSQLQTAKIPPSSNYAIDNSRTHPTKQTKSTPTPSQIPQYMYANCYGYAAAAAAAAASSYPNQSYCSFPTPQTCTEDDPKQMWENYQNTSRRMIPTYVAPQAASCPAGMKESYNSQFYRPNQMGYQSDTLRSRDKGLCAVPTTVNTSAQHPPPTHPPPPTRDPSMYTGQSMWPVPLQYQHVPQNLMMGTYDRYGSYFNETPNYDCCVQRQDASSSSVYQNYPNYFPNQQSRSHNLNTMYNSDRLYMLGDPSNMDANSYLQTNYANRNVNCMPNTNYLNYSNGTNTNPLTMTNENKADISSDGKYREYASNSGGNELVYARNNCQSLIRSAYVTSSTDNSAKGISQKTQNLREFLSSWNEDEEDNSDKTDVDANGPGNQMSYKNACNIRPKIHVGITVDGEVGNSQYINLPDIIIDIEKSKDTEKSHVVTASAGTASAMANSTVACNSQIDVHTNSSDKMMLLESLDNAAANSASNYATISFVDNAIQNLSSCNGGNHINFLNNQICKDDDIIEINSTDGDEVMSESAPLDLDLKSSMVGGFGSKVECQESAKLPRKRLTQKLLKKCRKIVNNGSAKNHSKIIMAIKKVRYVRSGSNSLKHKMLQMKKNSFKKMKRKNLRLKARDEKVVIKDKVVEMLVENEQQDVRDQTMVQDLSMKKINSDMQILNKSKEIAPRVFHAKTLKHLLIDFVNSRKFRCFLQPNLNFNSDSPMADSGDASKDKVVVDSKMTDETADVGKNADADPQSGTVPKLSDLCESLLGNIFGQNGVVLVAVDDDTIDNICIIECDIDPNDSGVNQLNDLCESDITAIDTNSVAIDGTLDQAAICDSSDAILSMDYHNDVSESSTISTGIHIISGNHHIVDNDIDSHNIDTNYNDNINNTNNNEVLKDFTSFHHEEIVPDNYKKFRDETLLKYLQNKHVVQKGNFIKKIIIDRIVKKYQRYIVNCIYKNCKNNNLNNINNNNNDHKDNNERNCCKRRYKNDRYFKQHNRQHQRYHYCRLNYREIIKNLVKSSLAKKNKNLSKTQVKIKSTNQI